MHYIIIIIFTIYTF